MLTLFLQFWSIFFFIFLPCSHHFQIIFSHSCHSSDFECIILAALDFISSCLSRTVLFIFSCTSRINYSCNPRTNFLLLPFQNLYFLLFLILWNRFPFIPCHYRTILFCHSCNPSLVWVLIWVFLVCLGLFVVVVFFQPRMLFLPLSLQFWNYFIIIYYTYQSRMVSLSIIICNYFILFCQS